MEGRVQRKTRTTRVEIEGLISGYLLIIEGVSLIPLRDWKRFGYNLSFHWVYITFLMSFVLCVVFFSFMAKLL